jgi:protein-serine/threonine kinase
VAPSVNAIEDLSRFPSESLHSFSFARQPEDTIQNRQNVLKRSIDFMRDKMGWAGSNPGLVAAQARLSGDQEVQGMVDLLSRAHIIGGAHGLGGAAPTTGPAGIAGNVFDKDFGASRSESPDYMSGRDAPLEERLASADEVSTSVEGEITAGSASRAHASDSPNVVIPSRPRGALKRTLTSTEDLVLHSKLAEALFQTYAMDADPSSPGSMGLRRYSTLPSLTVSTPSSGPLASHSAPHGHGSRWAPASQAIFTTEANAPWTITAANDLACLVFGVTNAEVRRLGILEVVKEERRNWLEEKLKDPDAGSSRIKALHGHNQRASPNPTTMLNVGNGITSKLLSKPPSRLSNAAKRRSQTDDGAGSSYASRGRGKQNHSAQKSRGVILCGDVVPIRKRNGALGSASLWVKEKKGGLIWVLEEILEDVAYVTVDEVGCVLSARGATEHIWGLERIRRGMDIKRLIPAIPRVAGTNTGALDYQSIADVGTYTARAVDDVSIPITVEKLDHEEETFRVSSFPHIAGIIVLNSSTLQITSSNAVFSSALFGQPHPEGLHVNEILTDFDKLLGVMTDEDKIALNDGIVVPEHTFRRARSLLAMRDGDPNAASIFLNPCGVPGRHRDGSEIMVDVQMRVVKSERSNHGIIDEVDDGPPPTTEVVYALWITYSRNMHANRPGDGDVQVREADAQAAPELGLGIQVTESSREVYMEETAGVAASRLVEESQTVQVEAVAVAPSSPSPSRLIESEDETPRRKAIDDFVVLEDMGQGAYGQVKLCRYRRAPGQQMVIKYVTKARILVDTWTRDRRLGTVPLEIHVLDYLRRDDLRHGNIVEMADFFEDEVNYYIEMIPHGLPGMDLFDYIELRANMEESETRKIFVQVAEAVHHLHIKAKVVHRDIKDENVILDGEGNIKLIDFGSAAYIKNGPYDVFVGTIGGSFLRFAGRF